MKIKTPILLLTLFALISCKDSNKRIVTEKNETSLRNQTISTEKSETPKLDSRHPKWLTELYPEKIKIGPQSITQKLENLEFINDSILYCTYSQSDGVCLWEYLVTFSNRRKIDSLKITEMCDHELSIPSYEWKESAIINKTRIVVMDYDEKVIDSLIDVNGKIKNNLDFLEAETIIDSTLTEFKIDGTGRIKK